MLARRLAVRTEAAAAGTPGAGPAGGSRSARLTLVSLPANTFTCLESALTTLWAGDVTWVRPSTREPLSALRLVSALVQAGWPGELIGFYPTGQGLLRALSAITDRQIVYGGAGLAAAIGGLPGVEMHGPMRVCALVTEDADPDAAAAALLPLVASDGGRFCTTVRAIFCPSDPTRLAERLAALLDAIPFPPDTAGRPEGADPPHRADPPRRADPRDGAGQYGSSLPLAASPDAGRAAVTAAAVTSRLGAGDRIVTSRPLLSILGGLTYLAPTLVRLAGPDPASEPEWGEPPLLGFEAPFPLATIMRVTGEQAARLTKAAEETHRVTGRTGRAGEAGGS